MKSSWIPVSALLIFFFGAALGAAWHDAPTYDEAMHLVAGYNYWKTGTYVRDPYHPPIARLIQSAPLLVWNLVIGAQPPSVQPKNFGDLFMFHNSQPARRILFVGRLMTILMTLGAGLILWRWTGRALGRPAAWATLLAFVSCPAILAHGHLCTTDAPLTLFYTGALFSLWSFTERPTTTKAFFAGLLCMASVLTKFSGLILFPTTFLVVGLSWRHRPFPKPRWPVWVLAYLAAAILCIFTVYRPQEWWVLLDGMGRLQTLMMGGREAFLCGRYSEQGWRYYFLVAFLLKSALPFILVTLAGFVHWRRCANRRFLAIWIYAPVLLYFIAASMSRAQIGIRHILPIYVLLCVPTGDLLQHLWQADSRYRLLGGLLGSWLLLDACLVFPYYISAFNELIPPDQALSYLSDSNLDWGQELQALGHFVKEKNVEGIYLSYFGSSDPHAYGIRYHSILPNSNVNHIDDQALDLRQASRVLFAVSATNLQGVYFDNHDYLAWLKTRRPITILGHSLFVYDITGDADAHRHLAAIYERVGLTAGREFELRWSEEIQKKATK